jgi:hypothetical protein
MVNEGDWRLLVAGRSPGGYWRHRIVVPVLAPIDYAIVKISLPDHPEWRRMGYFEQISLGSEPDILSKKFLYQEGRLIDVVTVNQCLFAFTALNYIKDYEYQIKVRYI